MMATSKWRRLLVGIGLALGMLLVTSVAAARGTVRLRSTSIDESNGTWKLKFTIDYGGRPPSAYIPMIFSFKPTMLYERSLTDQSPKTPVERRVPLQNQPAINLPMDVSFGDTSSGKIWRKTKFTIRLTRARDFQAGEYKLKVKLTRGGTVGRPVTIRLRGKNKPVDRRAMVFHDNRPKGKKKPKPAAAASEKKGKVASEDMGPDMSDIPDDVDNAEPSQKPPSVEGKPGGGCAMAGNASGGDGLWGLWLLVAGLALRRRDS